MGKLWLAKLVEHEAIQRLWRARKLATPSWRITWNFTVKYPAPPSVFFLKQFCCGRSPLGRLRISLLLDHTVLLLSLPSQLAFIPCPLGSSYLSWTSGVWSSKSAVLKNLKMFRTSSRMIQRLIYQGLSMGRIQPASWNQPATEVSSFQERPRLLEAAEDAEVRHGWF